MSKKHKIQGYSTLKLIAPTNFIFHSPNLVCTVYLEPQAPTMSNEKKEDFIDEKIWIN